ncbi:rhomboid family intramembrane serine protease [Alteribacillus iranensis]|uniref:Rhomboid family peptidase. Serine peptidase. MEROPS family S54 n=1 Tax=Alteribacillus iranensis TaxID=930128 RepID=A0A1I1ZDP8_9BACI|nr:rhomboid family intramembrane serine protease [Alteribacillus iranensis]SFE29934.1 rhomboid family peptidase. Serine peptidase. MEROPS family S54 [Alteribacillus iranensis]
MKANHLFWKFVYHLVIKENARIIDASPDKKRIWLEHENNGQKQAIRVARVEHDWMREIEEDQSKAIQSMKRIKRMIPSRNLVFYNIYVSTFPPVDLYDRMSLMENKENTPIQHFFVAEDPVRDVTDLPEEVLKQLGTKWSWEEIEENITDDGHEQYESFYRRETKRKQESLEDRDRSLLLYGKTRITYLLLMFIALMFFLIEQAGGSTDILTLIEYGAKYNPAILDGEWWRFFTSMFLHIGFFHLFMNSLALFYLGTAVERMYGSLRFIFIYFIAGLFGSLASFAFNEQVSAGASGAIFGCFGALLYFGLIHRQLFFRTMGFNVIFILAINLAFGFAVPAVDNGAHIGGLVGGFLASAIVHLPRHKLNRRQAFILPFTFVLAAGMFGLGITNDNKSDSPLLDLQIAQELLQENETEEAEDILLGILENQEHAQARFLLGNALIQKGNTEEALVQFQKAVTLDEEFPEAYYNLTILYLELGRVEEAQESFRKVKQTSDPRTAEQLDMERLETLLREKSE